MKLENDVLIPLEEVNPHSREDLNAYMRKLIRVLKTMYQQIARVVNANSSAQIQAGATGVSGTAKVIAVQGNDGVVYYQLVYPEKS